MSMLSAQCDELRAMAESLGLEVPQAATRMMEAADTIEGLEVENEKLREEFNKMDVWHSKELTAAMAENSKLRELVRDMWHLLFDWLFKSHEVPWKELEAVRDRMRELGVGE